MSTSLSTVVIKPMARKVVEVAGFLRKYKKSCTVSVEEMNQAIDQYIADKASRLNGHLQKRMQNKDQNRANLPE